MTTHTLYDGPAGAGHLAITARPGMAEGCPVWLVKFNRSWGETEKRSRCRCSKAAVIFTSEWLPDLNMWGDQRLIPCGRTRQIPPAVLADVEAWLRGRPVGEAETTTTTTEAP
jgi:hypothetical protein